MQADWRGASVTEEKGGLAVKQADLHTSDRVKQINGWSSCSFSCRYIAPSILRSGSHTGKMNKLMQDKWPSARHIITDQSRSAASGRSGRGGGEMAQRGVGSPTLTPVPQRRLCTSTANEKKNMEAILLKTISPLRCDSHGGGEQVMMSLMKGLLRGRPFGPASSLSFAWKTPFLLNQFKMLLHEVIMSKMQLKLNKGRNFIRVNYQ